MKVKILNMLFITALCFMLHSCDRSNSFKRANSTAPLLNENYSNFQTSQSYSSGYGVYKGNSHFLIQVPDGEYLLTYKTMLGTFYIVFRADRTAILDVGLRSGDEVQEATVYSGTVTDTSQAQVFGVVTVFSELGAKGDSWESLFSKDPDTEGILLMGGVGVKYVPGSLLELHIPNMGKYLLTYMTTSGTFEHRFRTTHNNSIKRIGLDPGVEVLEAYILKR